MHAGNYPPTNSSWFNRIEVQFTALRYFALDGTDHGTHRKQGSMIRRCIIWRNRHAGEGAYVPSSIGRTLPDTAPGLAVSQPSVREAMNASTAGAAAGGPAVCTGVGRRVRPRPGRPVMFSAVLQEGRWPPGPA
ncbi:hypothetical protein GCM10010381_62450 [Streptomyces xantholiticus]|nr:hypothetical protein GCM10010381_62450 [Streptomyces xantholiticus]